MASDGERRLESVCSDSTSTMLKPANTPTNRTRPKEKRKPSPAEWCRSSSTYARTTRTKAITGSQVSHKNAGATSSSGKDGCVNTYRNRDRDGSASTSRTNMTATTIHKIAPRDHKMVSVQPAQSKKPPHMKTTE